MIDMETAAAVVDISGYVTDAVVGAVAGGAVLVGRVFARRREQGDRRP